jgi:putative FmdB family regulatory protein
MPWYDYICDSCEHEFTEVLRIDDRKIPVESGCSECGEDSIRQLIGNISMADPANMTASGVRPDNAYSEVISKINEKNNIKGTRYEIQDRHQDRGPDINKRGTEWKYDVKKETHEKLRAKKGRGK